jgi:hypothetical protein
LKFRSKVFGITIAANCLALSVRVIISSAE